MAPTKTLLLIALLAAATTTTCALDAESNSILSKLFNSQQQQVATPQKKRGLFGRKKSKVSSTTSSEGEGEQTYSTYLTAALGIFLALGTWYLPINNSDDKQKIINKKLSMDYSTCTESISDLETTIDSSSSDDDDSVEQQQQKRQQLVKNKPPSGYGNFLSFIAESSPEQNEAEKKIAQVNQIKQLMIENEISTEKCNELFKVYDDKLDSLYKNLVRLKAKKNEGL